MPEVKVAKENPLAKREAAPMAPRLGEFLTPLFPRDRFFGLNPYAMLREFTDEVNRMFHMTDSGLDTWTPAVDVHRSNGDIVVTAELPGLKKDDVRVEVTKDALVIEGERKLEHKEDKEGYHRYERSYGKFYRSIPLPEGAKAEEARAELNEGVLKISIPAPAIDKARQVPIEAAGEKTA